MLEKELTERIEKREIKLKEIKPKFYLFKHWLSNFITFQIIVISMMLLTLLIPTELHKLVFVITIVFTEFLGIILSMDFSTGISSKKLRRKMNIEEYVEELN